MFCDTFAPVLGCSFLEAPVGGLDAIATDIDRVAEVGCHLSNLSLTL